MDSTDMKYEYDQCEKHARVAKDFEKEEKLDEAH